MSLVVTFLNVHEASFVQWCTWNAHKNFQYKWKKKTTTATTKPAQGSHKHTVISEQLVLHCTMQLVYNVPHYHWFQFYLCLRSFNMYSCFPHCDINIKVCAFNATFNSNAHKKWNIIIIYITHKHIQIHAGNSSSRPSPSLCRLIAFLLPFYFVCSIIIFIVRPI